jgi:toxin YoeB
MKIVFSATALRQYDSWIKEENNKILDRIDALIANIQESPFSGMGKPEPLKYEFSGSWSRRITQKHRLRYRIKDETIEIISCRDRYEKR